MSYALEFTPAFRAYFRDAPLSRGERIRILASLHDSLPHVPAAYREDAGNRVAPNSPYLWWQLVFIGDDG